MRRRTGAAAVVGLLGLVAPIGWGGGSVAPAGAQVGPTFTATPNPVPATGTIHVVLDGCMPPTGNVAAVEPFERFNDYLIRLPLAETGPGRWEADLSARQGGLGNDVTLTPYCGDTRLEALAVVVDVDDPRLVAEPWSNVQGFPDVVEWFLGLDCPPGSAAPVVTFAASGGTTLTRRGSTPDARGDWKIDVPTGLPPGEDVLVTATCGSVRVQARYRVGGPKATTTTTVAPTSSTTTSAVPPSSGPPPAAPAAPVAGGATFTG